MNELSSKWPKWPSDVQLFHFIDKDESHQMKYNPSGRATLREKWVEIQKNEAQRLMEKCIATRKASQVF